MPYFFCQSLLLNMYDNNKMQDTNELISWIDEKTIIPKKDIIENTQLSSFNQEIINETSLNIKHSESQRESHQFIQHFIKINIKEIAPVEVSDEQEKLPFERRIVDEINDLIFKLLNKGIEQELINEQIIKYFENY